MIHVSKGAGHAESMYLIIIPYNDPVFRQVAHNRGLSEVELVIKLTSIRSKRTPGLQHVPGLDGLSQHRDVRQLLGLRQIGGSPESGQKERLCASTPCFNMSHAAQKPNNMTGCS